MIYTFARRLEKLLAAKQWSVPVVYGPEAFDRLPNCTQIVIFRDGSQDSFVANRTHGAGMRAPYVAARDISATIRVFAQATTPSATRWDHENLVDCLVDAVFCAARRWANEVADDAPRNAPITFLGGRIIPRSELPGVYDRFTGVIYDLSVTLQRAVLDLTSQGAGYSTALIPAVDTDLTCDVDPNQTILLSAPSTGCYTE